MTGHPLSQNEPELSIVVPARNEHDNLAPLVQQVKEAIIDAGIEAQLIIVDDGSDDSTLHRLIELSRQYPWLRVLHRDRPMGQSAALYAGIQTACSRYVATLDADLQNDPADLPKMLQHLRDDRADMVQGDRTAGRKDNLVRKVSSWVGRATRRLILHDPIRDTGCSTRMLRTDIAKQYPLQFMGMHRYMPVYARMMGARVIEMPVNHRPRVAGATKYGILNRGLVGLFDCLAVRWMLKRYRNPNADPLTVTGKDIGPCNPEKPSSC